MIINSFMEIVYHLNAYHNKINLEYYLELRKLRKLTKQMDKSIKKILK